LKISLSSFLYFNYPLDEAVRRTAAAGFEGIDIWGGRPHAFGRDRSERELFAIRRLIADEGLEPASFIPAQFRYPTSLCSPMPVIHRESIRYIQDGIETASALGAPVVSICPGHTLFRSSPLNRREFADKLIELSGFRRKCKFLKVPM
jgi:protein FrlC